MSIDRTMLKQALTELVKLKGGARRSTSVVEQLYNSALMEWSEQLGVEQSKLNKLVKARQAISDRRLH